MAPRRSLGPWHSFTLRLPVASYQALKMLMKIEDRSMHALTQRAVEEYISNHLAAPPGGGVSDDADEV